MIRKIGIGCCIVFLYLVSVVTAQECKVLRVAGNTEWLPVAYIDENTNKVEGIAHDFITLIGKKLNIPVIIKLDFPWKRMLEYLKTGDEIDLSVAIYWNKEREKLYLYTDPFFVNESRAFVLKGKEFRFEKFEDLLGKVGGCTFGSTFGDKFDAFIKEHDLQLEGVKTIEQRVLKLQAGRNDYFIQDYLHGMMYLKNEGLQDEIVALPYPISTTEVHFAFSRQSPCKDIVPKINEIIRESKQDGTLQEIIDRYIK